MRSTLSLKKTFLLQAPVIVSLLFYFGIPALSGAENECIMCHGQLTQEKVVHAAVQMGCEGCHSEIDAAGIPHKNKGKIEKGLSSSQPDLCYGCHEKKKFSRKVVHAALGMGCTSCHNPHSSKNMHLLNSDLPDLCYNCHDKTLFSGKKVVHAALGMGCTSCHNPHSSDQPHLLKSDIPDVCYTCHEKKKFIGKSIHPPVGVGMCISCHKPHQSDNQKLLVSKLPDLCYSCHDQAIFSKKNVHPPVAAGECLLCHAAHASEEVSLLRKDPPVLCLSCHTSVRNQPHAIMGFSGAGHPLGLRKGRKTVSDPSRPGKRFYCGSCHDPHSSDSRRLLRFGNQTGMGICRNCHKV